MNNSVDDVALSIPVANSGKAVQRPPISVIVPAYNVEKFIEESINSIVSQTVGFDEVIVVNDGSTDSTRVKLKEYEDRGEIVVIDQENSGIGAARNAGLERARGEYVYFMDSDDILENGFVKCIQNLLARQRETDMVLFAGQDFCDKDGAPDCVCRMHDRKVSGVWESGIQAALELDRKKTFSPVTWLYVSRRSLWMANKLRFWALPYEDQEMINRLSSLAGLTIVAEHRLYRRRIREGSAVHSRLELRHRDAILGIFKSVVDMAGSAGCPEDHKAFLRGRMRPLFVKYMRVCHSLGGRPDIREYLQACRKLGWFPSLGLLMKYARYAVFFNRWLRY